MAKLARFGGTPLRTSGFAPWPHFSEEMINATTEVLRSGKVNYWTGQHCRQFEQEYAESLGVKHAIAVSNGTVALELALQALDIPAEAEVIVASRTFVATASAVAMRGCKPVFADIDPESGNVSAETIAPQINSRTRAIIVVHMAGWPCEMDPIMELANLHGLSVIEDCAQAHGSFYKGRPIGSIGHMSCFSFCQDKIMTTCGEGGMVCTNSSRLWERAWSYKDHGKSWEAVYHREHKTVMRLLHESVGTNWRMTEMQGAVGRLALQELPQWIDARRQNAHHLIEKLQLIEGIHVPMPAEHLHHSYYKCYATVELSQLAEGWTRDEIVWTLQAEGIPCGSGSCCEIYQEKAILDNGWAPKKSLPNAAKMGQETLMFQVHPTLSLEDMSQTAGGLAKVMEAARSIPLADFQNSSQKAVA